MSGREIVCYDHKGRKFKNINEMCKHWRVSPSTYKYRIKCGKSLEYALTAERYRDYKGKTATDHKGNRFNTVREMMEYWGIDTPDLYYARKRHGWTLEERLTGERDRRRKAV